jgi:hypothetical protein
VHHQKAPRFQFAASAAATLVADDVVYSVPIQRGQCSVAEMSCSFSLAMETFMGISENSWLLSLLPEMGAGSMVVYIHRSVMVNAGILNFRGLLRSRSRFF